VDEPDYSTYSLDELEDARRHVDRARYPERLAEIEAEIERRGPEREADPTPERPFRPSDLMLPRRSLAVYLVIAGVLSFARTLDALRWSGGLLPTIVAVPILLGAYGGMILGGVSLWRGWARGILAGGAALLIQIPLFRLGRVAYSVAAAPCLELKVWPRTGFAASTSNLFTVFLHDSAQPFYLGLNAGAAVLAWAVFHYGMRRRLAEERLRRRGV